MLFAKVPLALPFIGAAFASPVPAAASNEIASDVQKRDIDILAVVTELKTSISADVLGINLLSTETEVQAALVAVLAHLDTAHSAIGSSTSSKRDGGIEAFRRELEARGLIDDVAGVLADVIQLVDGLVDNIAAELKKIPLIAGLLASLGPALGLVLAGVDLVLAGVLLLVGQILGALGISLSPILGSLNGLLGGLLGGLFP